MALRRRRSDQSLQHLSQLELEVYNCRFNRGFSQEETLQQLESTFPGVSLRNPTMAADYKAACADRNVNN